MKPVFIDTSYLIALLASDDANHSVASARRLSVRGPFLTTEYAPIEPADALARVARDLVCETIDAVRTDRSISVIPASTELTESGLALFRGRHDKSRGLTDRIPFVVMQQEGVTDALTADRHFEQAGCRALLRSALQ